MKLLTTTFAVLFAISLTTAAADKLPVDPNTATLAAAVEDWIAALDADDLAGATARWAKDDDAAKTLKSSWPGLKQANEKFTYRKWIDAKPGGAAEIADAKTFKIGGHSYNHLHIDWTKTDQGWRVARVWICR